MPKKTYRRGRPSIKPERDSSLINKLRKECIHETEEHKYQRLKDVPNEHPPFFGESVRIIQGKEIGPRL